MRSVLRALAVLVLTASEIFCAASVASAEEAKPRGQLPNLANRLQSVRFFVAFGRVQAIANEAGVERSDLGTELGASRHEKLVLNTNADQDASIQYELSMGGEQLTVAVDEGRQFTIRRRPAKDVKGPEVEFRQPNDGPLTLRIDDRETVRELSGPTLWHLLLAEPNLCRLHLLPLLEMFRPDWRLVESAQSIEDQMLRTAGQYRPENLKNWDALVADLASDRFVVRQRAERELRAASPAVIPYLESLDHRQLDFEQWARIQHIVEPADTDDEDQPDVVARRLMPDRRVWLGFLDRPGESTRRTAAEQLSYLFGERIQFDPAAAEAIRRRQMQSVRKRVEQDRPANVGPE